MGVATQIVLLRTLRRTTPFASPIFPACVLLHPSRGDEAGMIQVVDGKSKAARRVLPMTPAVYRLLRTRHKAQGFPEDSWIFSSPSKLGHLTSDGLSKQQHKRRSRIRRLHRSRRTPYVIRHSRGLARRREVMCSLWRVLPAIPVSRLRSATFIPKQRQLTACLPRHWRCRTAPRRMGAGRVRGMWHKSGHSSKEANFTGFARARVNDCFGCG
jgi:hypothetical protein